jgi:hypothetical protein
LIVSPVRLRTASVLLAVSLIEVIALKCSVPAEQCLLSTGVAEALFELHHQVRRPSRAEDIHC